MSARTALSLLAPHPESGLAQLAVAGPCKVVELGQKAEHVEHTSEVDQPAWQDGDIAVLHRLVEFHGRAELGRQDVVPRHPEVRKQALRVAPVILGHAEKLLPGVRLQGLYAGLARALGCHAKITRYSILK